MSEKPQIKFTMRPSPSNVLPGREAYDLRRRSVPRSSDHRAWAAHWGEQVKPSIEEANRSEGQRRAYYEEQAIRCARLAFYHASVVIKYRYWEPTYWAALGKPVTL